ncbi:MAG TPA: MFS transporter [Gammaproteobacteria bacterium]|jgi:predicted MFS family arabinose efflux permease|nr:MFS transporter [Gammaproteobacteria bacterium]
MTFLRNSAVAQYLIVTGNYWAFTLTDGALRMLVVLHFHSLGYSPLDIAMLFIFYELFGVVTNLFGGLLGARIGLNRTMNLGLGLQIVALAMLLLPTLTVPWVMAAQALSGVAKDLNKMSAKSAVKHLAALDAQRALFRWVAVLTGSKNALKGAGFFLGGLLLAVLGFDGAMIAMLAGLACVWVFSLRMLRQDMGKARHKPRFSAVFSRSRAVNILSAARLFLFGARDVWFVIAVPVYLSDTLDWSHSAVGGFLALWIIAYGAVQSLSPWLLGLRGQRVPDGRSALLGAVVLTAIPAVMAVFMKGSFPAEPVLVGGLLVFGLVFAMNSSIHSYLIVAYAKADGVSVDVGFYYMANAMGRLLGTVLSGWLFQVAGLVTCLWVSSGFLLITAVISIALPRRQREGYAS